MTFFYTDHFEDSQSSLVHAVYYNSQSKDMVVSLSAVEYGYKDYGYEDVSELEYEAFLAAYSRGEFYNSNIKGKHGGFTPDVVFARLPLSSYALNTGGITIDAVGNSTFKVTGGTSCVPVTINGEKTPTSTSTYPLVSEPIVPSTRTNNTSTVAPTDSVNTDDCTEEKTNPVESVRVNVALEISADSLAEALDALNTLAEDVAAQDVDVVTRVVSASVEF